MVRGICTTVATLCLFGSVGPAANAAAPSGGSVRLGSGISVATGDFGLDWGTGAPVAVALAIDVAPRLRIGADVAHQTIDESIASTIVNTIFGEHADLTMWRVGARGEYALTDPGSRWLPHLIGGVAVHPSKIEVRGASGSHQKYTDTGVGASGGVGLDYRLSPRWALGLESVYYWVKSDKSEMKHATMPYLDFNLGLRWGWGGERT